eukprot:gene21889-26289_t
MASVTFESTTCLFPGSNTPAVDKLDLEIEDGEFLVLVGPSGCGKSTTLRMLAGLEDVHSGRILIGDRDVEAMTMGDRVAVLEKGILQQCASPRELYNKPKNVFVAGFMGSPAMNLFTLPVVDGGVAFGDGIVPVPRETMNGVVETEVVLGIRPEHLEIAAEGLPMEVDVVEELGSDAYVYGRTTIGGRLQQIVSRGDWRNPPQKGERVNLRVDPEKVHIFATTDGRRLGVSRATVGADAGSRHPWRMP